MKKPRSGGAPAVGQEPCDEFYLRKTLEFGKRYEGFERSSVELLLNLVRSYDMIWGHFSRLMSADGLSPAVLNTLMILCQNKGKKLKQHEISKLLLVSRANVTGLVNTLVRKGLARRVTDKKDRRAWLVQITGKGEDLLKRYLPVHYVEIRRIFSRFSSAEKTKAVELFHKFKNGIRECSRKK